MIALRAPSLLVVGLALACSSGDPTPPGSSGGSAGVSATAGSGAGGTPGAASGTGGGGTAHAGTSSAGNVATGGASGGAGGSQSAGSQAGGAGGCVGDCGGSGPLPAELEIAKGQKAPTGIALDAESVYWANRDAGTIVKCPLSGCGDQDPQVLASNIGPALGLDVGKDEFYWMAPPADSASTIASVQHCPLSGCTGVPEKLFEFTVMNKAVDVHVSGDLLYYAAWPLLGSCPTSGCDAPTPFTKMPAIAVDSNQDALFVGLQGGIIRCTLTGCQNQTTIKTDFATLGLAIDSSHVYFTQYDYFNSSSMLKEPTISRCPLDGCGDDAAEVIKSGDFAPFAVVVNDERIFYTDVVAGTVVSLAKPK